MRELYVSPNGNKKDATGTADNPYPSLEQALTRVRRWKQEGALDGETTILLRGGEYLLTAPIRLTDADSAPLAVKAFPGEKPVFSGGRRITGFMPVMINGVPGWRAILPDVKKGWNFQQLYVNGRRRERPRYPKTGFLWIEKDPDMELDLDMSEALFHGNDRFHYAAGDLKKWRNLSDVDVMIHHFWIQERMPVESLDEQARLVTFRRRSVFGMKDDVFDRYAKYTVENVYEEMNQPGQWYLDRAEGALYYIPLPGEEPDTAEVIAPAIPCLLEIRGKADANRYVEHIRFEGVSFCYGAWVQPSVREYFKKDAFLQAQAGRQEKDFAESPQAASHVPGCLALSGARHIQFKRCRIEHVGWYAVEIGEGCHGIQVLGCTLRDLGAGGVKINGGTAEDPLWRRTTATTVADCTICDGGRMTMSAVGILSMHAAWNHFVHNHIHDFFYSGISCGWIWGYAPSSTHHNEIAWNHIHDLGKGQLSDMGGIYTLGEQPGTTIRCNYIHDIVKSNYGGWGVYLDEGSSHIVVERNICVNLSSQGFHQHYGRENLIRNNVFALGGEAQLAVTRPEDHVSLNLEKNIFISDGKPIFNAGIAAMKSTAHVRSDLNLFCDRTGDPVFSPDEPDWSSWQKAGLDRHSVFTDPLVSGLDTGCLTWAEDTPARSLGFEPFSLEAAGPREDAACE